MSEERHFNGAVVAFKAARQKGNPSLDTRHLLGRSPLVSHGHPGDQPFDCPFATSAISPGDLEAGEQGLQQRPVWHPDPAPVLDANMPVAETLEVQGRAVTLTTSERGLRFNLAKIAAQVGDEELARKELQALQAVGAALPSRDEVIRPLTSL